MRRKGEVTTNVPTWVDKASTVSFRITKVIFESGDGAQVDTVVDAGAR